MRATEHVEYLLRQGRKAKELIELGFPKSVVTRMRRKLKKERSLKKTEAAEKVTATKGRNSLSKAPGHTTALGPKLELTESQWEQIENLLNTLPELADLMAVVRSYGIVEREICWHIEDGVCTMFTWDRKDEISEGIGERVPTDAERPEWHIKPSIYYCALCTVRIEDRTY